MKHLDGSHYSMDDKEKKKLYVAKAAQKGPAAVCVSEVAINSGNNCYFASTVTPLGQGPNFRDCTGHAGMVGNYVYNTY